MTDEYVEEDLSLKTIGRKWFVFLRLLVIVYIAFQAFHFFNPYVKHEFKVYQKDVEVGYFAMSKESDVVFFTEEETKDEFEIGEYVWVFYKKGDISMHPVKVKKR